MMVEEDLWERLRHTDSQTVEAEARAAVETVTLSPSERESIAKLLKTQRAPWMCDSDPKGEWLDDLRYRTLPLSPKVRVILAEAGPGCARGAQGSNGAMWLIRFDGRNPILLASPQQEFNGFLYSIEPTTFQGYRDVIVGWGIGAGDTVLAYFRFDGKSYRCIARATLHSDERGVSIVPR